MCRSIKLTDNYASSPNFQISSKHFRVSFEPTTEPFDWIPRQTSGGRWAAIVIENKRLLSVAVCSRSDFQKIGGNASKLFCAKSTFWICFERGNKSLFSAWGISCFWVNRLRPSSISFAFFTQQQIVQHSLFAKSLQLYCTLQCLTALFQFKPHRCPAHATTKATL